MWAHNRVQFSNCNYNYNCNYICIYIYSPICFVVARRSAQSCNDSSSPNDPAMIVLSRTHSQGRDTQLVTKRLIHAIEYGISVTISFHNVNYDRADRVNRQDTHSSFGSMKTGMALLSWEASRKISRNTRQRHWKHAMLSSIDDAFFTVLYWNNGCASLLILLLTGNITVEELN